MKKLILSLVILAMIFGGIVFYRSTLPQPGDPIDRETYELAVLELERAGWPIADARSVDCILADPNREVEGIDEKGNRVTVRANVLHCSIADRELEVFQYGRQLIGLFGPA